MTNVVGRYQHVVVVRTEEKSTEHREEEHAQPDRDVACPYETASHDWGDEDHDINEGILLGRKGNRQLSVRAAVPKGCGEMNYDKPGNQDLGHEPETANAALQPRVIMRQRPVGCKRLLGGESERKIECMTKPAEAAIEAGTVKLEPWSDVKRRIEKEILGR